MIPPVLLFARVGPIPVVIPVVFLWPILGLAWGGLRIPRVPGQRPGRGGLSVQFLFTALGLISSARGLQVELRRRTGPVIALRLY